MHMNSNSNRLPIMQVRAHWVRLLVVKSGCMQGQGPMEALEAEALCCGEVLMYG